MLLACGLLEPKAPPPFTCDNAAEGLGRPKATVIACDPLPHLPEVVMIALEDAGARETFAVVVKDGRPLPARGGPALATFLDSLGAERTKALEMGDINGLIRAFDAFPSGFGPRDWNFDMPDIGRSSFTPSPFTLTLLALLPPPPENATAPPEIRRATLSADGGWAWRVERRQPDGAWAPIATQPLASLTSSPPPATTTP